MFETGRGAGKEKIWIVVTGKDINGSNRFLIAP